MIVVSEGAYLSTSVVCKAKQYIIGKCTTGVSQLCFYHRNSYCQRGTGEQRNNIRRGDLTLLLPLFPCCLPINFSYCESESSTITSSLLGIYIGSSFSCSKKADELSLLAFECNVIWLSVLVLERKLHNAGLLGVDDFSQPRLGLPCGCGGSLAGHGGLESSSIQGQLSRVVFASQNAPGYGYLSCMYFFLLLFSSCKCCNSSVEIINR